MPLSFGTCCLPFLFVRTEQQTFKRDEETVYSKSQVVRRNQAKQKGNNLPAFHGARFQQGYGLGSIFKGLFRWGMPNLKQGAKVLGKKALQTGAQVAQDVLEGNNVNTVLAKRSKEVTRGLVPHSGSGRKATKRKMQFRALPPFKKPKTVVLDQDQDDFQLWS